MIMLKKKPALTIFAIACIVMFVGVMFAIPALHAQTTNAASESTITFAVPTEGMITISFGEQTKTSQSDFTDYKGTAIVGEQGTPVYAAADGVVIVAEWEPVRGNYIRISHGENYETVYAHLDTLMVEPGDQVKQGQWIGTMGSTGRSTGTHLAFQLLKDGEYVDSEVYIAYPEK